MYYYVLTKYYNNAIINYVKGSDNMAQANLSVRVDEKDKKNFELFCSETGMNVSVAINMFIKAVLREHKLPFEVTVDPFYSEKNIQYLEKIVKDINEGKAKFVEQELVEDDDE